MSERDRESESSSPASGEAAGATSAADASSQPRDPSRRRALSIGIGVLGGGLAAAPLIPALGYLVYPLSNTITSAGEGFIDVGGRGQFGPTVPVKVDLFADRKDAWSVTRQVKIGSAWVLEREGELKAFSTVCPHLGCAIDFDTEANAFRCPCHRSEFDLDGTPVEGPSPRALDTLEVKEESELVAIRYRRFRQNISEKVEV